MRFAWIAEPPFGYAENGRVTGCDVELARRVFAAIGEELEPVETQFAALLDGLEDGRWDVTVGMFVTAERAARAAFTRPIWGLRDGLLVRAEDAGRIDGYRSLARSSGRLAVLEGQVQRQTALALGIAEDDILVLHEYAEAARAVAEGRVAAYASVERAHREHLGRHGGAGLDCVAVSAAEKPAAAGAFACRSAETRDRLDRVLHAYLGSAEHHALLATFGLSADEVAPPAS